MTEDTEINDDEFNRGTVNYIILIYLYIMNILLKKEEPRGTLCFKLWETKYIVDNSEIHIKINSY